MNERLMSAGGLVYRRRDGQVEIVVCGTDNPENCRLPKGTPIPGEAISQTALREVQEETGLQVQTIRYLDNTQYNFVRDGKTYDKIVHFYLMQAVGGDLAKHDHEFNVVEWVPIAAALDILTFNNEREIARQGWTRWLS